MRHHGGAGRRARLVALASVVAVPAAGCSTDGGDATSALPVAAVSTGVPGWGDDHRHVVVLTDAAAARAALPADAEVELASSPPVPAAPDDQQTFEVHRADGTVERVDVPDESLVAAAPGAADADAVAAAGVGALLVVDVHGVIGVAGAHYVLLGTVLTEVPGTGAAAAGDPPATEPPATDPPATEPPASDPSASEPPGSEPLDDDAVAAALAAVPGVVEVELRGPGVFAVATDGDPEALAGVPGVASVTDDVLVGLFDDPRQGEEWYLANTGAPQQSNGLSGVPGADLGALEAWRVSEGAGTVVAVIDSGVDIDHTDFTGRIWSNSDEICNNGADDDHNGYVDDCKGWDFGASDANPRPDAGVNASNHGTHVAGIIAAGRNGVGVVGVAPAATIMPLKVMATNGQMATSSIYSALLYAADNGATVVNMSLGTEPGAYTRAQMSTFEAGISYARSHGVTVVVAAGNSSADTTSRPVWPAEFSRWYDNQITVSASTNSDTRASFSNWGPATNVWAPGAYLLSTLPGGTWGFMSGTSMASPAVAGVVAAVRSSGTATTPSAIRQRLVSTSASVSAGPRVDMAMAVGARQPASVSVSVAGADAVLADQPGSLGLTVAATGAPASASGVRISLAAAVDASVYAVSGVEASFHDADGAWATATTGDDGAFPVQPIRNATALAGGGWQFGTDLTLPSGDYAMVVELVDSGGARVGKAKVTYLTVADTPPSTETPAPGTAPATTAAPVTTAAPGTTAAPATTAPRAPSAPGTTAAPVTTTPAPGGAPATTAPAGGGAPATTAWSATTAPAAPGTTAPRSGGTPVTTAPGSGGGAPATTAWTATTVPATTAPAPVTTSPRGQAPGTTAAPATTAPASTNPPPPSTTPTPSPDRDGSWVVSSMDPRLASTAGGAWLTIQGNFPTQVPVYVWFGDLGIVEAASFGDVLLLQAPAVARADVTDVLVRFRTDHDVVLTLSRAFTFVAPSSGAPSTTTPGAPATTVPGGASGGGGGGGGGGSTGGGNPATTAPTGTAPATTAPSGGAPGTTVPAVPGTTTPAAPVTTAPAGGGGTATTSPAGTAPPTTTGPGPHLRTRPSTGAVSTLQLASWPRPGCRSAACPAADLG